MVDGIMLLWFGLTALSLVFVAVDIRGTPESPVLKWGFILLTAYTGPIGAFLYVLGCREPLPGLHERYVAVLWRQVLGSTMHCVSGDGVGILAGAVIGAFLHFTPAADIALEYLLGFGFGWSIFQALFMREAAGGSYRRALANTFIPELVSMNALMAGMVPVMRILMPAVPGSADPLQPAFWFVMSMALLAGFVMAYPLNWWLVSRNLKHGMMTVRPAAPEPAGHGAHAGGHEGEGGHEGHGGAAAKSASSSEIALVTVLSFAMFAVGLVVVEIVVGL